MVSKRKMRAQREPYAVVELKVTVTVELPAEHAYNGQACDDPAIECALSAMPQMLEVFLWGKQEDPARVYLEASEDDAEVIEDGR